MGEIVRVVRRSRGGQWWRVQAPPDGYSGWARAWGLVPCTAARAARWRARARARVIVSHVEVLSARGRGIVVTPVFWSGRFIGGPLRGGYRRAEFPDGRRGWVRASAVAIGNRPRPRVTDRVHQLLGIPYLWGGRTTMGLDCSALVQLILEEQGLELPRDARDQWRATMPIPRGTPHRAGDLVFFGSSRGRPGHVGLTLGGGYFIHARGRVRINSIDPDNTMCDKELQPQLMAIRALRAGARMVTRGISKRGHRS